jgi:hypothetical protein
MPAKKALHESTLNFKRTKKLEEFPIHFRKLHVRETLPDIIRLVQDRGIVIKGFGPSWHKNKLVEGTLVMVYCNERTTNVLEQRTQDELDDFIATKLHVIRDDPPELKGERPGTKINTEITNDNIAQKAYNLEKDKATGKIFGNL